MSHGLCSPRGMWPTQGWNADWLTGKTEHWLADWEAGCLLADQNDAM